MKTYIYTAEHSSPLRGCNRTVIVYRIKNNQPIYIGTDNTINTASSRGDYAVACQIISDCDGHKMLGAYKLKSKNVKIVGV